MTTVDTLRAARDLIARGWCQEAQAYDTLGRAVSPRSDDAVVFCAIGAIARAAGDERSKFYACLTLLRDAIGLDPEMTMESDIAYWNDERERTQDEVLTVFDRAIEIAERSNKNDNA